MIAIDRATPIEHSCDRSINNINVSIDEIAVDDTSRHSVGSNLL